MNKLFVDKRESNLSNEMAAQSTSLEQMPIKQQMSLRNGQSSTLIAEEMLSYGSHHCFCKLFGKFTFWLDNILYEYVLIIVAIISMFDYPTVIRMRNNQY